MAVVGVASMPRPVCVVVTLLLLLVLLIVTKKEDQSYCVLLPFSVFIHMGTFTQFLTLSALSSGSSSVKNSLLGYGIWQPANTLKKKNVA